MPTVDSGLIAVLGVTGGSVASVGAQLMLGWRARRTDAIAGARIVYSALADTLAMLNKLEDAGHPRPTITTNLGISEAVWGEHGLALARSTNIEAFHRIQVAFVDIRHIRDALSSTADNADLNVRASRLVAEATFGSRLKRIERARELALNAGTRLTDRPRLWWMNWRERESAH